MNDNIYMMIFSFFILTAWILRRYIDLKSSSTLLLKV